MGVKLHILLFLTIVFCLQPNVLANEEKVLLDKALATFYEIDKNPDSWKNVLAVDDLNEAPIGLKLDIANVDYSIAVSEWKQNEKGLSLTVFGRIILPQIDQAGQKKILLFAASNILLSFSGNLIGTTQLSLIGSYTLPFQGGKIELSIGSGTSLEMDCKGFKSLTLEGDILFPDGLIKKTNCDDGQDCRVSTHFSTTISDWNDLLLEVSLPAFEIVGLKKFVFETHNAVLDLSDSKNSEHTIFTTDYTSKYLIPGQTQLWKGLFIQNLRITLPPEFKVKGSEKSISFEAENFLLDNNGISGLFSANNILSIDSGSASGWAFSVEKLSIGLDANKLTSGGFDGLIRLPVSDTFSVRYKALIRENGEYSLTVQPGTDMRFDFLYASVDLYSGSSITLKVANGKFVPKANLSGMMHILPQTEGETPLVDFKGILFENLCIQTEAPYISIDRIGYNGELKIMNFPLSIGNFSFAMKDSKASLHLQAGLALGKESFEIGAKTDLDIEAEMRELDGVHVWKFKGIKISDINIKASIAEVCRIEGTLSIRRNDPVYGDGFEGSIRLSFDKVLKGTGLSVRAIFGKTDFNYWLVDGLASFSPGIPIFSGVSLTGFGGGAYMKMQMVTGESIGMPTKTKYTPNPEVGFGLKAAVSLCIGTANAVNAEASFEVAFNRNGGIMYAGLFGQASFLNDIPGMDNVEKFVGDKFSGIAKLDATRDKSKREDLEQKKMENPNSAIAESYEPTQTCGSSGLLANMAMMFDFKNRSFHANFELYANFGGGFITGNGPNGLAGWSVLHIEEKEWYLHMGTPTQRIGVELNLAGIVRAQVGSYFMFGDRMPAPPSPPKMVLDILGKQANNNSRNQSDLEGGRGIAFGTDFSISTGNINAWIVYARLDAGLGFDIMLKKYQNVSCEGRPGDIGINGWYASGQAYAFLQGEIGVCVNLLAIKKNIPILKAGTAALLQAKLPKPSWVAGSVGVKFEVLGGLIKGNVKLDIEFGEECKMVRETPSLLDIDVITDLTPATESTDVDVFTSAQVAINMKEGSPFEMNDNGETKIYRLKLSEFSVLDGTTIIPGAVKWQSNRLLASFDSYEILPPLKKLKAIVKVIFEEYKNGQWEVLFENGKKAEEQREVYFTTGTAPNYIPLSNIEYCYPVVNQQFYYIGENPNGQIQLKKGQSYLFEGSGLRTELHLEDVNKNLMKTNFIYDKGRNSITYKLPSISTENEYKFSLITFASQSSVAGRNLDNRAELSTEKTGNVSVRDIKAGTMVRDDAGTIVLNYKFNTSKYKTFSEKISMLPKKNTYWLKAGNILCFEHTLNNSEGFDDVELIGNVYTGHKPLISVKASLDDSYYKEVLAPKIYNNYPVGGEIITKRSVDVLGVPPAKAISIDRTYLEQVKAGNYNHLASSYFPYLYDISTIYYQDYIELQSKVANKYKDNLTAYADLVFNQFRNFGYGVYNIDMQYCIPGDQLGTKGKFSFNYK